MSGSVDSECLGRFVRQSASTAAPPTSEYTLFDSNTLITIYIARKQEKHRLPMGGGGASISEVELADIRI